MKNLSRIARLCCMLVPALPAFADVTAVVDRTDYNVGSTVRCRLQSASQATAAIRYAGEDHPLAAGIRVEAGGYQTLWTVPNDARTGRYAVDLEVDGVRTRNATSFAVFRKRAEVMSIDFGGTFFNSGDSLNARIVVRNMSNESLKNVRVEFGPFYFPWIAQDPDQPPIWTHLVNDSLALAPGETKELDAENVVTIQAPKDPVAAYYTVVLRDNTNRNEIYDLAFASPVFAAPPNLSFPKAYPFLYLYHRESDVRKSESYRNFYPPEFVSKVIRFDTQHTMFPTGVAPSITWNIDGGRSNWKTPAVRLRLLDSAGKELQSKDVSGAIGGRHTVELKPLNAGRYVAEVSVREGESGGVVASNLLEIAVNPLPKSILVFCAHQDDDTVHPATIQAAVQNGIPIHFVYFTAGDAGECDKYFQHSCDPARAMDFGEVRMDEARSSLGHLGVPHESIFFLGLPDGGSEQIWDHVKADHPYLSVLLASDHSPYKDAAKPNLSYSRESTVAAAREFILKYKPELIITGHPDERHVDHRTNNWFVVKAMQELLREGAISPDMKLIVDLSYGPGPQKHAPYKYEKDVLYVSGEAARTGQEALWYYQSQDGNKQQANIVDYGKLPREEIHYRIVDWQKHEGWNEGDRRQ